MKAIIVHRWDGTPQSDWYPWLKKELEKTKWKVIIPRMPNTSEPEIKAWVNHLQKIAENSKEEILFVGHSIGCQTILRYLAVASSKLKVRGIVLVAPWLTLQNLEDKEAKAIAEPWIKTPIDFGKVKEKTKNIIVILSDNDQYVDYKKHKRLFAQKLNARIIVEKGKGHFTAEDGVVKMPVVLKELENFRKE